jgi:hypothetical protein
VSAKGLKRVSSTRFCGELFSNYCREIDNQFKDVFADCVADYVSLVVYIKSRGGDPSLKAAYHKHELSIKSLMKQYEIERTKFCKMERETRVLTDQKMFSYEETRYMRIDVKSEIRELLRALIKQYPYLYGRKKEANLTNAVDRCILFRIMLNNDVFNNKFYREIRIDRLIAEESYGRKNIDYILKKIY